MQQLQESIIALFQQQQFTEAENVLKQAISKNPLDAQLWVMLGEALLLQNQGQAAKRVFDRAWLLDPQAQWVNHIYKKLEQVSSAQRREDIDELLKVPKVTVAAAILTQNEAANIANCIMALQGAVDEILVVDSSTDETRRIAARYPKVKVIPITWEDDFAAARNSGLPHVESDWVIWVDADDILVAEDVASVREAAGVFHHLDIVPALHVWHLNQVSGTVYHDFSQIRMFPVRRGLRFLGRVHEQIGTSKGIFHNDIYRRAVKIRLQHHGYEPSVMQSRAKFERNLRLLKLMTQEDPDNPGHWLYYGRESLGAGEEEQALAALLEAERLGLQTPSFGRMPDVYKFLVQMMMVRKDYSQAETYCLKAITLNPDFPDMHFNLAQVRMKQADALLRLAESSIKKSLTCLPSYRGSVSADYQIGEWKAEVALGELAMRAGKLSRARGIFNKHLNHPDITEGMKSKITAIESERQRLNKDHA
ncbi:glycosyltransferase [Paenibacillus alba]|uniref:Tetratricopeptide repeat protein n=1 Tax=Paenibacillus alba TaxID=1197127 RepID=A0ABU6G6X2_9BACL|nr:glycosyltransferase [Paenibacillus alba]MEC0229002.1 tetratricopeptide repeat protein [Paenibacillus alba]